MFTNLFIGSLRIDKQGELQTEEAALVAPQLLSNAERRRLARDAGVDDARALFKSAAALANHAGFRVAIQDTLHSTANYPALTADEWVERLSQSEIFRRAHGKNAAEYARLLGEHIKRNPRQKH